MLVMAQFRRLYMLSIMQRLESKKVFETRLKSFYNIKMALTAWHTLSVWKASIHLWWSSIDCKRGFSLQSKQWMRNIFRESCFDWKSDDGESKIHYQPSRCDATNTDTLSVNRLMNLCSIRQETYILMRFRVFNPEYIYVYWNVVLNVYDW